MYIYSASCTWLCNNQHFFQMNYFTAILEYAPLQRYRATLSTTDLRCAPSTGIVHHGELCGPTCKSRFTMQFCTSVHLGGAQWSFVLIRWCTRQFCMFDMDHDRDVAQYNVVNLGAHLSVCVSLDQNSFQPAKIHMSRTIWLSTTIFNMWLVANQIGFWNKISHLGCNSSYKVLKWVRIPILRPPWCISEKMKKKRENLFFGLAAKVLSNLVCNRLCDSEIEVKVKGHVGQSHI